MAIMNIAVITCLHMSIESNRRVNMSLHNIETYDLIEEVSLDDINSKGYILKHKKTGARVCCVSNDDNNKVFYIGFRTPPEDSTGVAHIIEHSVLCGSAKYPSKDPFVELAKGSLNTFLNAMTYPDKTVYPIASCNDQDFNNLMDVYLDAVFHPNIYSRPQIFQQEGWHYELNSKDEDIELNGVVYSEMKGAFSSPDDVFDRVILDSLFPDTCYGVESGGDPDVIPDLTYEQFLDFHKKYYHPSNSYIYLYGDMDMEEKLEYIDREYLCDYDELSIDSSISLQRAFDKAHNIEKSYPITNDEPLDDNTYMSYNTVIGTSLDERLYIAFQVIEYALLSAPGAVLKQALLDSGICKDVDSAYDNGLYQPYFSIIIKNSNEKDKEVFLATIKEVLQRVCEEGFDRKALLAGINLFEFKFREADFGHYPKGLMYGLQALDSWLYDDTKPFIHIEAIHTFEYLKAQVGTDYYEKLVKEYLLDNTHASVVVMSPQRGLTSIKDKELSDKLKAYKESLLPEQIEEIINNTKALKEYQEEPDSDEILNMIPLLKISDIKKEADPFIYEEHIVDDITYVTHDIFTGGIGYLTIGFDITGINDEYLPYVGLIKGVLGCVDTDNYEYADLANEIFLNAGGISINPSVSIDANDTKKHSLLMELKAKVLYDKLDFAFDILQEIILTSNYCDKKRLKEIICTSKSRIQSSMVSSGHVVSAHRAMSHISRTEEILEKISGIELYRVIESIEGDFDNKAEALIDNLIKVAKLMFTKGNLRFIDYVADKSQYDKLYQMGKTFAGNLPEGELSHIDRPLVNEIVDEGFKTSAKVQYVSKAGKYIDEEHPYTGALKVLKVIMGYDYLWNEIRVKGGAYGAFATFYKAGEGCFMSYRDPNLDKTIEIYNSVADYLREFNASERDMTKYIIGTIANMDIPLTPSAKGVKGLDAYLSHDTYENIQKERDEVLGATKDSIRKLAGYVDNIIKESCVCVIGGEEMIVKNKSLFDSIEPLIKS